MPPLILVLDEARVGPADDDGVQLVRPVVVDELRDVELGRRLRVLGQSDRLPVDEHVENALERAEVQHDGPALPPARHPEATPVDAGLVLVGHVRRQIGERHLHVGVLRRAEALHRPEARHVDLAPAPPRAEDVRRLFRPRGQAELPLAVERGQPGGAGTIECGVSREPVQARELRQHPTASAAEVEQLVERHGR